MVTSLIFPIVNIKYYLSHTYTLLNSNDPHKNFQMNPKKRLSLVIVHIKVTDTIITTVYNICDNINQVRMSVAKRHECVPASINQLCLPIQSMWL